MKPKVAIVGIVGIPAKYGGFETLAQNLVTHLEDDFAFTVYCSAKVYPERRPRMGNVDLKYLPFKANGIQSIIYDAISMIHAIRKHDIILILGVSGGLILPFVKLFRKKKIIINIDGLEWKRDKWNTYVKAYLKLSEKISVRYGDIIIADNAEVQKYIDKEYNTASEMIEYGGDHVLTNIKKDVGEESFAFTVCRIEPENNIHMILEAFSSVNFLKLKIVGNWKASAYGLSLLEKYKKAENISMIDPIYDQSKLDQLRNSCSYYIHGHSAGGTNPSLVEAMFIGLPIIAYDVNYNRATTENKAVYFKDAMALSEILKTIDRSQLEVIRKDMKEVADRRYRWKIISNKYKELFV